MAITPRPRGAAVVAAKSPKPAPGILLIDADTVGKVTQTRARCCLGWCAAAPAIGDILDDIRQNIRTCAMGRVHHLPKRVGAMGAAGDCAIRPYSTAIITEILKDVADLDVKITSEKRMGG